MSITQKEANEIEIKFMEAWNSSDNCACKAKEAWDALIGLMERENNYSDSLGVESLDWQIGNWANDVTMELHNAGRYRDCIEVNEDILKITWHSDNNLFHENALREIADEYSYMGEVYRCYELYEDYLKKDSMWGWGWIGYYRQLDEHDDDRFESVLDDLYKRLKDGVGFRDKEDLCRELGDEYNTLGNTERANFLYTLENEEKEKNNKSSFFRGFNIDQLMVKSKKIYPNELCPCGSGKKYKKCCGRN